MRAVRTVGWIALLAAVPALAQAPPERDARSYAPLNSWAVFTEYSNSSSHIILGSTRQRKFAGLGASYQRRISAGHGMVWAWSAEVRPFAVESDPTIRGQHVKFQVNGIVHDFDVVLPYQVPVVNPGEFKDVSLSGTSFTYQVTYDRGRRWTYAPAFTPAAFTVHFLPKRRLQPFLASSGGFTVSPRDIPLFDCSAFNFLFSFGGGLTWYRDHQRSWSVDYRVQHLSNKSIGDENPGIDSQFVRVGYSFGR